MYNLSLFIIPFIMLCLFFGGFGYKTAQTQGKIPIKWVPALNLGIVCLFVLSLGWAISKIIEIDHFRALKPEEVVSIQFYNEAQAPEACQFQSAQLTSACLEQTISDKIQIARIVNTFRFSRGYTPNHEGVNSPYLAVLKLKQADNIWLFLGKGVRNNSLTTRLEIQQNPVNNSGSNIYTNAELYQVLKKELKLKAWR